MLTHKPPEKTSPTLVKQYSYCPVIPWIQAILGVYEPPSDSMIIGRDRVKPVEGQGQVYVSSMRGSTVIDEVLDEREGRVLVEKKAYRSHNYSRYVEQAITSYIVASERIHGVRKIRLIVQDESRDIEVSKDLVEDVEHIVELLEKTLKNEKPPPSKPNKRKCTPCWYKRYCPHY